MRLIEFIHDLKEMLYSSNFNLDSEGYDTLEMLSDKNIVQNFELFEYTFNLSNGTDNIRIFVSFDKSEDNNPVLYLQFYPDFKTVVYFDKWNIHNYGKYISIEFCYTVGKKYYVVTKWFSTF